MPMLKGDSVHAHFSLLREPALEFRFGQKLEDPHAGLALVGPFDAGSASQPTNIPYGLIATRQGIELFAHWARAMQEPLVAREEEFGLVAPSGVGKKRRQDRRLYQLWHPYPGFEAAFACKWPRDAAWSCELDRDKLLRFSRNRDPNKRAFDVVNEFYKAIKVARERDEALSLFICVVPDEVWMNCRPESRPQAATGVVIKKKERLIRQRQPDFFADYEPESYELAVDFRRQLKARAMEFSVPTQIIRESTLRTTARSSLAERGLTPQSDRAWNLSTTLYYKAGGKPWRLATAREGVCYVGLAFRRAELHGQSSTACCAAQMFLDTGDGVVFRGEFGPWYSAATRQFHLDRENARNLLAGVLAAYERQGGRDLKEIFLHSRSDIDAEEFAGYKAACPDNVRLTGIRVRSEIGGVRLYRTGDYPVIRGTLWKLHDRSGYLWASGFKPALGVYDGWEVPNPLRIDVQHGEGLIAEVAADILGLTKLNYNACKLGDAMPVTVGFSDAVGEILVSNPSVRNPSPSFKFYI